MEYIQSIRTEHTGGNCMADVIELHAGHVVVIADECLAIYPSMSAWQGEAPEGFDDADARMMEGADIFERGEGDYTFVKSAEVWEEGSPCALDLITLYDGRVIEIGNESVNLYASRAEYERMTEDGTDTTLSSIGIDA